MFFLILLHLFIKFQVQIPSNKGAVKKISNRSKLINMLEISLFYYI
jgi:hypothetical protein